MTGENQGSKTFTLGGKPALDGNGYHVGDVTKMVVTIFEDPHTQKAYYSIDYYFYNGSGTWRGSQSILVKFINKEKATLTQVSFPLDRGRCIYGSSELRHIEGAMPNIIALIDNVDFDITRVTGTQTGC
jgi:hypothetical protein